MTPTILALLLAAGLPVPPQASQLPPWYHWLFEAFRPAGGGSGTILTVTGVSPLALVNALAAPIHSLKQYGKCEQSGTPTPSAPVDIVCNNGALKARRQSGLPLAYQMVGWIKPSGAIPITGFKTKSTQEITTVFYRERSGASYLYSSDTATSGTTNTTAYLSSGAGNWRWDGKSYSVSVSAGIKTTSIQNKDGVWLNGTKYGSYTDAGEFISTNDLRLSSGENTTVRIYSQTIREGEAVTLDLVPVQRLSDSAYGFYDKVSGTFHTNPDATFVAGDPIDDPVEIYTDGTPEVLTVSGKNLFDPTKVLFGYYRDRTTGNQMQNQYNFMSSYGYYIPCLPNTAYTFVGTNKTNGTYSKYNTIYFFDSAKNYLGASPYEMSQPTTGTTPSNCYYLQIRSNPLDTGTVTIQEAFQQFNWQLELGSTVTDYEPYHAQTVTDIPMLLAVGNYKDEAELIQGIKMGKVGIKVFDGTETFTVSSSGAMITAISDVAVGAQNTPINTHFALEISATSIAAGKQRFGSNGALIYSTNYYMKHPTITTVADFKAFLAAQYAAGTPVIVVYPLAEETTEQTTPHSLHSYNGTTIVTAQTNVDPVTLRVEYKGVRT